MGLWRDIYLVMPGNALAVNGILRHSGGLERHRPGIRQSIVKAVPCTGGLA